MLHVANPMLHVAEARLPLSVVIGRAAPIPVVSSNTLFVRSFRSYRSKFQLDHRIVSATAAVLHASCAIYAIAARFEVGICNRDGGFSCKLLLLLLLLLLDTLQSSAGLPSHSPHGIAPFEVLLTFLHG